MKLKDKIRRISESFAKELEDIKIARVKLNVDKKLISDARITEGIKNDPDFPKIKSRLIKMPRAE